MHAFVGHLRRVRADRPGLRAGGGGGGGAAGPAGADPLAPPGAPLYRVDGEAELYGGWFFWFWDNVFAKCFRNLLPENGFEVESAESLARLLGVRFQM